MSPEIHQRMQAYLQEYGFSSPEEAKAAVEQDGSFLRDWIAQLPAELRREAVAQVHGYDCTLVRIVEKDGRVEHWVFANHLLDQIRHNPRVTILD